MTKKVQAHLKAKDFGYIKELMSKEYTTGQISELTGRSNPTICRIRKSETYDQYRSDLAVYNRSRKEIQKSLRETKPVVNGVSTNGLSHKITTLDSLLNDLRQSVEQVIEEVVRLKVNEQVVETKKELSETKAELEGLREFKEKVQNSNWTDGLMSRVGLR